MDKNVFERRADELKIYKRADGYIFPEDQVVIRAHSTKKPPYISVSWLQRFLDLNRRQRIDLVDADFVRLNIVGSGNESKFISALQFLGLINDEYIATTKLSALRVFGKEYQENLQKITKDAYVDLISVIILEAAKSENLINFFIQRYNYSYSMARGAARLFIWLATQSGLAISDDLKNLVSESEEQAKSNPKPSSGIYISSKSRSSEKPVKSTLEKEKARKVIIHIHLDSNTPRDIWERVLTLVEDRKKD